MKNEWEKNNKPKDKDISESSVLVQRKRNTFFPFNYSTSSCFVERRAVEWAPEILGCCSYNDCWEGTTLGYKYVIYGPFSSL